MKIICAYCGSYLESEDFAVCPFCTAPLGDTVKIYQKEQEEKEKEQQEREERLEKEKLEAAEKAQKRQILGNIASAAIGGIAAGWSSRGFGPRWRGPKR